MKAKLKATIEKFYKDKYTQNISLFFLVLFSYMMTDISFRYIFKDVSDIQRWFSINPNLFTFGYMLLLTSIIYILPKKASRITYAVTFILCNIYVIAQSIHHELLGRFFAMSDLVNTKEGSHYMLSFYKYLKLPMIVYILIIIILYIYSMFYLKKIEKYKMNKFRVAVMLIIPFIFLFSSRRIIGRRIGLPLVDQDYQASVNVSSIYHSFSDNDKVMVITGYPEFIVSNLRNYVKEKRSFNEKEAVKTINEYVNNQNKDANENEKTGIFKDKNLIFVMLESVDNFLVNEEEMPTLYNLSQTGINFTKRYAPTYGSGYTLNTEFALNTGLYSNDSEPPYLYINNSFPYSLANTFKNEGYDVNSLHANTRTFYNRKKLHENAFGYTKHYSAEDMKIGLEAKNDYKMISDDQIYNYIINKDEKFMTFITTYTGHLPYDKTNNICASSDIYKNNKKPRGCLSALANTTDKFVEKLISRLEEDELLDNTVLVFATDHYVYGFDDQKYIKKIKGETEFNMLNNVPFIVWSKDMEGEVNETPLGSTDILPTVLNMFGVNYNPNNYLGTDVYSSSKENYVYFNNSAWFDGNEYIDNFDNLNDEQKERLNQINTKKNINNLILKSNYYKKEAKKND